jgi:hypothetical protein
MPSKKPMNAQIPYKILLKRIMNWIFKISMPFMIHLRNDFLSLPQWGKVKYFLFLSFFKHHQGDYQNFPFEKGTKYNTILIYIKESVLD